VRFNMTAVGVLGVLMVTVTLLTAACIILPIVIVAPAAGRAGHRRRHSAAGGIAPHLVYFGTIGFGFMLVEISQVQRLTIFLGHPVYSLSVVLFSLLLSSGVGSYVSARVPIDRPAPARWVFAALLLVLVVFGAATPFIVHGFDGASTVARIAVSVATLLPIGFLMGMAFPLGMRRALAHTPSIAPWLWGVNGAASVCASVLVVVIALGAGISAAFWAGTVCYALAAGTLIVDSNRPSAR
jgi:hypothetical protein